MRRSTEGTAGSRKTVPNALLMALLALGLVLSPWSGATPPAAAANSVMTVNTRTDSNNLNDATLSLRVAIRLANGEIHKADLTSVLAQNQISGDPGGGNDIIVFDSNVFNATSAPFTNSTISVDCGIAGGLPDWTASNGKIDGEARNVVLVPLSNTCSRALGISSSGSNDVIKDIRIASSGATNKFVDAGVRIAGSNNTLTGVQITPDLGGSNEFSAAGSGVVFEGSGSNNLVQPGGDSESCVMAGSTLGAGVLFKGSGSSNKVISCNLGLFSDGTSVALYRNKYGVLFQDSASGQVGDDSQGNSIGANTLDGINIISTGQITLKSNRIGTNNNGTAVGNGGSGVLASKANQLTMTGNLIFSNTVDGVQLAADPNTVNTATIGDNNQIGTGRNSGGAGNGQNGINALGIGGGGLAINNNFIGQNTKDGIVLGPAVSGGSYNLTGNKVGTNNNGQSVGNKCNGITISADATTNFTLTSNTIQNNSWGACTVQNGGVVVGKGNNINLNNNHIDSQRRSGAGVWFTDIVTSATVTGDSPTLSTINQNGADGVVVDTGASGPIVVKKSSIGSNGGNGVWIVGGKLTTIGGDSGDGNKITGNSKNGVAVETDPTQAKITSNTYGSNGGLAIDLAPDSSTGKVSCGQASDPIGPGSPTTNKSSANGNGMLCPIITTAAANTINGTVNAGNCANSCLIQVYKVDDEDEDKHGEGTALLGEANPDGSGNWSVSTGTSAGTLYSATATNRSSNPTTSEFALNVKGTSGSASVGGGGGGGGGGGTVDLQNTDGGQDFGTLKVKAKKCADSDFRIKNNGGGDGTFTLTNVDVSDDKLSASVGGLNVGGTVSLAGGGSTDKTATVCASKKAKKGKGFSVTIRFSNGDGSQSDSANFGVKVK